MKRTVVVVLLCLSLCVLAAQSSSRSVSQDEQAWTAYFVQARLSSRWGIWSDIHLRRRESFLNLWSQIILRPGLIYYLSDQLRLSSGYAYIHHFPAQGHLYVAMPEHRVWQQVQWYNQYPRLRMMQWLRTEQRFRRNIEDDYTLGEGYSYNLRLRYNMILFLPLTAKRFDPGGIFGILNDEIHLNPDQRVANFFDHNRFFAGFGVQLGKHTQLHAGYMNFYQQRGATDRYLSIHAARIFLFQQLDFRK